MCSLYGLVGIFAIAVCGARCLWLGGQHPSFDAWLHGCCPVRGRPCGLRFSVPCTSQAAQLLLFACDAACQWSLTSGCTQACCLSSSSLPILTASAACLQAARAADPVDINEQLRRREVLGQKRAATQITKELEVGSNKQQKKVTAGAELVA